jgi:glutamate dehydrogenase/leucine dehydrogenase
LKDPATELKSIIVIDNSAYGMPTGGIRMASDISLQEIIRLARAMTLKHCTYRSPMGGAKSGIIADPSGKNRDLLISSYANLIAPLIKEKVYLPGPDMGTNKLDQEKIMNIAGTQEISLSKISLMRNGYPIEDDFTGYGVVLCLKTLFEQIKSISNSTKTPKIILEGFGKVGKSVAIAIKEFGYNLVGLSTIKGAIYDEDGLDIAELLELRKNHGDSAINKYHSKNLIRVKNEKLFTLSSEHDIDFIIPGARPDSINEKNIDNLNAKAIVSAANIPYAEGMVESLEDRGIIAFPDFVSNGGAAIVELNLNNPWTAEDFYNHLKMTITEKTNEIVKGAHDQNVSYYNFAKSEALKEFKKYVDKRRRRIHRLNKKF